MSFQKTLISDFCLVTDFVANGSFESLRKNVEYLDGDGYAILVRLTDFTKNWKGGFKYVTESAYKFLRHSYILPNDLLMSNVGEPGKVFLVPDLGKPMTLGPNSILIRPESNKALQKYIYYYFLSSVGSEQIRSITSGVTQKKFNKTSFRALEINLPSLRVQQKVVEKLDAIFAEIDKASAAAEANIKNADTLFKSYLTEIFENPGDDWCELKIRDLGKVVTGNTPKTNEPENYGDFVSFVKPGDFNSEGTINYESQKLSQIGMSKSRVIAKNSALMVCIGATIGKCGFSEIEVVTNQQINSVTPTPNFNHKFIYFQMLTNGFQKKIIECSGQATLPIINKSKWESLSMRFPPLKIQLDIIDRLDSLRVGVDYLKKSQLKKILLLQSLKELILNKAFNGQLIKE